MNQDDLDTLEFMFAHPDDPDYVGLPMRLAKMVKEQGDLLAEAMGIIIDLAALHDSYIGYLVAHNNYNEAGAKAIAERIDVLRLKQ